VKNKYLEFDFGTKLRKLRELKGWQQKDMAEKLDIQQNTYSKLETGQVKLSMERFFQICDVYEMSPIDFLKFDESMVFNNHNQTGGNAANVFVDNASEKLVAALQSQIEHLLNENAFLRNMITIQK
jgi:transcriptional regulator with XRE-family HTH domain